MAMETLVCYTCGDTFERERVRGRKPKACPPCKAGNGPAPVKDEKREVIFKSEEGPQVIDPNTGKRDPKRVPPCELEIPDTATESTPNKYMRSYDQMLVDGNLFKEGDVVKIRESTQGRYKIREFVVPEGELPMYVGLIGVAGIYEGKWRTVDPWRIYK